MHLFYQDDAETGCGSTWDCGVLSAFNETFVIRHHQLTVHRSGLLHDQPFVALYLFCLGSVRRKARDFTAAIYSSCLS